MDWFRPRLLRLALMLVPLALLAASGPPADDAAAPGSDYAALRRAARERPRRVILNNDGCDVLYFPRHLEVTRENFLARRTTFLAGSCDTLMYCPVSGGQGHFTLPLPGCDFLTADPPRPECMNIAPVLFNRGEDYFQWLLEFCHGNGMELFFSFRFNDVHDQRHTPDNPSLFFAPWKESHRHLLFGRDHTQNPQNGWWTSVDFSHPEPRDRQVQLVKTVLERYDVDGIDLDFSRYLRIFLRTAQGQPATREELDALTAMMREIRAVLDDYGRRRHRGLLLSVVLPDSVTMCRELGYDLEQWFREGLVDIWQQHDGGQMHAIAESAALAHRHGVKYYAFSGSPYPYAKLERGSLLNRAIVASYAGRAGNAIAGGADGLYLYNVSNPATYQLATTIPQANSPRNYFVTGFAWETLRGYDFTPEDYQESRQLTAHVQCTIAPGDNQDYQVEVNQLPAAADQCIAYLDRTDGPAGALRLSLNGTPLATAAISGRYESFTVPPELLRQGMNRFTVGTAPAPEGAAPVEHFRPGALADFEVKFFGAGNAAAIRADEAGGYLVTGDGNRTCGLAKRFDLYEYTTIAFSCRARLQQGTAVIRAANGGYAQTLQLLPGMLWLEGTDFTYALDTTQDHHYELILHGPQVTLRVDGQELHRHRNATSSFLPDPLCPLPPECRLYYAQTIFMMAVPAGNAGAARFADALVTSPPASVRIANLMLQCLPVTPAPELPGQWREISGDKGKRELDGRALPVAAAPGKRLAAAELRLRPGTRRNIWAVSDGAQVAAWVITSQGASVWSGSNINILLNDGTEDTYLTRFAEGTALLYRNGNLLYRLDAEQSITVDRSEVKTHNLPLSVADFLQEYGRNFTAAEQKVLQAGGVVVRGLRDPEDRTVGQLEGLRLLEVEP